MPAKTTKKTETDYVLVRMPSKLKEKIRKDAFASRTDMTATINKILSDHYGIPFVSTSNRAAPFGGGAAK